MTCFRIDRRFYLCALLLGCLGRPAEADDTAHLAVPRYVSMRHGDINLRVGPGTRYPVSWVFTKQNLPVEITQEFENWRKIKSSDGTEGWVTAAALQGKRFVIVLGTVRSVRHDPTESAVTVAKAEAGVIGKLDKCPSETPDWCQIEVGGSTGWLRRDEIWGVLPDEIFPTP